MRSTRSLLTFSGVALGAALAPGALLADSSLATVMPGSISWSVPGDYAEAELFVGGPNGSFSQTFENGARIQYYGESRDGGTMPDGFYTYSLSVVPEEVAYDKAALAAARDAGDEAEVSRLSRQLQEGDYDYVEDSGSFKIKMGLIERYDAEADHAEAMAAYRAEQASVPTDSE